jgi:invasion protein IalB
LWRSWALGSAGFSAAQQAPGLKSAPSTAPTAPTGDLRPAPRASSRAAPSWVARCSRASRDAPLECAIEQTAILSKTGQLIVLVNIRVPSDTHTPVAMVQLPPGLNLPNGPDLLGFSNR